MRKALIVVFILMIATFMFAQEPHLMYGYVTLEDGTTAPTDLGFEFWEEGTTAHFYYNYPGNDDNAPNSGYSYAYAGWSAQLSILDHAAGDQINFNFIDNATGQTKPIYFIRSTAGFTDCGTIHLEGGSTWTLSGNIGMPGVTFTATGTTEPQATSDEYGNWAFECENGFDVTITPAKIGYVFDPAVLELLAVSENMSGIEFTVTELAPDAPINPYPADGATGVAGELPYLWWNAPEGGAVAPTSYFVTLSENADYSAPIIDNMETVDPMYAVPATSLMNATMYYAKVVPHYAPPARAANGFKKDTSIRKVTKATKVRGLWHSP